MPELRLMIWEQLMEDQPLKLERSSWADTEWAKEPPITQASRGYRRETLPLHYARTAFMVNTNKFKTYEWMQDRLDAFHLSTIPLKHMRKLTIHGLCYGGQVALTVDLCQSRLVDARWKWYRTHLSQNYD